MEKVCRICGVSKDLSAFGRHSPDKNYLRTDCKQCASIRVTNYRKTKELEMNLNQSKFTSIFNGLSAVAKKTYEAVPIASQRDASQIRNELIRAGSANDLRTTTGCLNTLVSSGLIREPVRGTFIRIEVKQKTEKQVQAEVNKPTTPLDALIALMGKFKDVGNTIAVLTKEMEAIALDVEEQLNEESGDSIKLKQLQSILKSLG